jgi:excisionase family DNA binding protein
VVQPLLSKRDVAVYLGVSERTVNRLVVADDRLAYRVGGQRRFRRHEVDAYVDASQEAA